MYTVVVHVLNIVSRICMESLTSSTEAIVEWAHDRITFVPAS